MNRANIALVGTIEAAGVSYVLMNLRVSILIALLVTSVAASPAPSQTTAPATPSVAPIRIDSCSVSSRSVLRDTLHSIPQLVVDGVSVRFTDTTPAAATQVDINVRYDGLTKAIVERGDFSSGVTVERKSATFGDADYAGPNATCSVAAARFSDGTTWNAEH
jgi:hypothetical protein